MKQWAKIVVTLERAVPAADAQKYLEEYSIGLGPSDDPRYEQRGVMVIKTKSKTRAKQRRGAVSNWKYVLKTTLTELKKRGMTGEEMRRSVTMFHENNRRSNGFLTRREREKGLIQFIPSLSSLLLFFFSLTNCLQPSSPPLRPSSINTILR